MFGPPIIQRQNLEFIAVSSVSVLAIMVIIETVRVCNIYPKFSALVNTFLAPLLDHKDAKRTLVTSHMELLLASVSAVWVNQAFPHSPFSWTESTRFLLCGLLTVGVGDSAAAIGGLNMGKPIKFPYSAKSLQGFISFIISVLTALSIVSIVDTAAVIATIASALTEVYVERFDNIALPLVFAATMLMCRTVLELPI
jgi:dolichol kinase